MKKLLASIILSAIFLAVNLCAEDRVPQYIPLYNEQKPLDEVSTIFISPTDQYLEMHIKEIDGRKFNEEKKEYIFDIDKYLVLPGAHNIVVGYAYYTPGKYKDRKKAYDELKTSITTKPNYMYELCQNRRTYVSDPKEIRVREYKPGEQYFEVYRMNVKDIRAQIEKLNPKDDGEKISDQYNQLARTYQKLREHKDAVDAYEKAIKFNQQKAALYYGMMVPSLIELKDYSKALQSIEQMKKYEKRNWVTNGLYGEVYGDMGQYDKALDYFKNAVNDAPLMNKEGLRRRLAYFYERAGMGEKHKEAMKEMSEDRDKSDKLYVEITEEVLNLQRKYKPLSEDKKKAYEVELKQIIKKHNLTEDKLFMIITTTLEKHEKEFAEKYKD